MLIGPLKNLCFEAGDKLYNLTHRFTEAVEEYNEAYTQLSEDMKFYHQRWKELGDNFYKYVS